MFKKILCIAMALLVVCACSLTAFADMGAPPYKEIRHTVNNYSGLVLYEADWDSYTESYDFSYYTTVPYGETIVITGEWNNNGEVYGTLYYNDEYLYVKMSDLNLANKTVKPDSTDKLEQKAKLVVINKEGVQLYSGPSYAYSALSVTIPYGTTLEYEYDAGTWAYVTYNGTSGWIYNYHYGDSFNCADVHDKSHKIMVVQSGTSLLETPDTGSSIVASNIPYGTVLSYKYEYHYPKSSYVFVEYNGVKGWVETKDEFGSGTAHSYENRYTAIIDKSGVRIYAKALDRSTVLGTVPYNVLLNCEYSLYYEDYENYENSGTWNYINYNGISGWIFVTYKQASTSYWFGHQYKVKADTLTAYSDRSTGSESLYTLKKGETYNIILSYDNYETSQNWHLVTNGEVYGWVDGNQTEGIDAEAVYNIPQFKYIEIGKPINTDETTTVEETTEEENAPEISDESQSGTSTGKSISPFILIILCIAGASVIAITAVVMIIIIIKKGK